MNEIKDFDILRPTKNIIKLGGEEIDVSFIPTGITFEVQELLDELGKVAPTEQAILDSVDNAKKAYDLSIDLCVLFCSVEHPTLSKEWFMKKTSAIQIRALIDEIKKALNASYEGVRKYGKNG